MRLLRAYDQEAQTQEVAQGPGCCEQFVATRLRGGVVTPRRQAACLVLRAVEVPAVSLGDQ